MKTRLVGIGSVAIALLAGAVLLSCQPKLKPGPLNVLVILIDTLRADHLGCYGYPRATSPNIDNLASTGTLFENATAPSSWTLPSAASLLTGLYPTRHQTIHRRARLPEWRETLPEILRERGYRSAAVVSHTYVSSDHRLDQGFDVFDESNVTGHLGISSPGVTEAAIRWLQDNGDEPFFLFLHYFDPHFHYLEHEGFVFETPHRGCVKKDVAFRTLQSQRFQLGYEGMECIRALYDSEIAFTDHHVGRVLDEIQRIGLAERTIVVVTGDHGEEFMDHQWLGHTVHLYEETVRVPLIIRNPTAAGGVGRVSQPVELIDIPPTLLDMLGVEWDEARMDGRSFVTALLGGRLPDETAFSEVGFELIQTLQKSDRRPSRQPNVRALREGAWKLIHDVDRGRWELFNLESDPKELADLTWESTEVLETMKRRLLARMETLENLALAESAVPDTLESIDKETEERLRALGYVD